MKFRKRPIVVDAIQWNRKNIQAIYDFAGDSLLPIERRPDYKLRIKTLEGIMCVSDYDWIIKGVNGEFYFCKPDIFEKTYEVVE